MPLWDYLCPKDLMLSSLLRTTKDHYFTRISVDINPNKSNFRGSQWITSENINVEHLLNVFTTIDANLDSVWSACAYFMQHLYLHKHWLVILKPKIKGLPDDHSSKPGCLFKFSQLFDMVGDRVERNQLLTCALILERERGSDYQVAQILRHLSAANGKMRLHEEGVRLVKEALEIYERLGDMVKQAQCFILLAWLLVELVRL